MIAAIRIRSPINAHPMKQLLAFVLATLSHLSYSEEATGYRCFRWNPMPGARSPEPSYSNPPSIACRLPIYGATVMVARTVLVRLPAVPLAVTMTSPPAPSTTVTT